MSTMSTPGSAPEGQGREWALTGVSHQSSEMTPATGCVRAGSLARCCAVVLLTAGPSPWPWLSYSILHTCSPYFLTYCITALRAGDESLGKALAMQVWGPGFSSLQRVKLSAAVSS